MFKERLGITLEKEDEMECLVAGANFLLKVSLSTPEQRLLDSHAFEPRALRGCYQIRDASQKEQRVLDHGDALSIRAGACGNVLEWACPLKAESKSWSESQGYRNLGRVISASTLISKLEFGTGSNPGTTNFPNFYFQSMSGQKQTTRTLWRSTA